MKSLTRCLLDYLWIIIPLLIVACLVWIFPREKPRFCHFLSVLSLSFAWPKDWKKRQDRILSTSFLRMFARIPHTHMVLSYSSASVTKRNYYRMSKVANMRIGSNTTWIPVTKTDWTSSLTQEEHDGIGRIGSCERNVAEYTNIVRINAAIKN